MVWHAPVEAPVAAGLERRGKVVAVALGVDAAVPVAPAVRGSPVLTGASCVVLVGRNLFPIVLFLLSCSEAQKGAKGQLTVVDADTATGDLVRWIVSTRQ